VERNFNYIKNIHDAIKKYYNDTPLDVWTTFNFLSGKCFVTKEFTTSPEMNELKDHIMKVNEDNWTLSEFYYNLLPFNLNWKTISKFQRTIFSYIDSVKNRFFSRHIKMIAHYLKHKNSIIDRTRLILLKETFKWYEEKLEEFNYYLNVTGININHKNDRSIITLIKNSNEKDVSIIIQEAISLDIEDELNKWIADEFPYTKENCTKPDDCVHRMRSVAINNCTGGAKFINAYISTAYESFVTDRQNMDDDTLSSYCQEHINDFFQ